MPQTLEQAQDRHHQGVETNRALGVIDYETPEPKSERIYEVTHGYKGLPGGKRLGPGQRFNPTEKQVADGSLRGKARELTQTEYNGLSAERQSFSGADIGIRALPMADGTLKIAMEGGLTEADFEGVEPGWEGRYTRAQVEELVEARAQAGDA